MFGFVAILLLTGLFRVFLSSGRVASESGMLATVGATAESIRQFLERDSLSARRWEIVGRTGLDLIDSLDSGGNSIPRISYRWEGDGRTVRRTIGGSETAFLLLDSGVPANEFSVSAQTRDLTGSPTTDPASVSVLVVEIAFQRSASDPRHVIPLEFRRKTPLRDVSHPLDWPGK